MSIEDKQAIEAGDPWRLRRQLQKMGALGHLVRQVRHAMHKLFEEIEMVANTDAKRLHRRRGPVPAKRSFANTISTHFPRRRQKPFNRLQTAARSSPTLIESELFGSRERSLHHAIKRREGYFEGARGWLTVTSLDEITEGCRSELQVKLLRVPRGGEVPARRWQRGDPTSRLASSRRSNRDPARRRSPTARCAEDLYYRLKVFPPSEVPYAPRAARGTSRCLRTSSCRS